MAQEEEAKALNDALGGSDIVDCRDVPTQAISTAEAQEFVAREEKGNYARTCPKEGMGGECITRKVRGGGRKEQGVRRQLFV